MIGYIVVDGDSCLTGYIVVDGDSCLTGYIIVGETWATQSHESGYEKLKGVGGNWATVGRRSRGGRRVARQREKRKGKSVGLRIGTPSDSTPLTVLGDFKLHSSDLLALLNSFSLSFNSCPPTHKEGNVLDLVFTHPSPATDMTVTPLHISDHHLVSFTITLPVLPIRNFQHLSLTRRNLHSISPSSVASCILSSLPDHESFSSLPLDSAPDTLLSSLSSTMDLLCPLSTIRKKNSSTAPWLSDVLRNNRRELRSASRKWKKSKLDTDLISYRTLLSIFSLDVTSAKTSFYKKKLETSAQDPQKLHNIFSSLLNPPAPPSPSSLTAEDFATFYTEKIERICQTFTSLPTSPTSHSQHSATPSLMQLSTEGVDKTPKQHIPQRLPFWQSLRNYMLLDHPNCHRSSSSSTCLQHLTQ
ncbi:hypothetical protein QTP86_030625 [Hemibagrus guttatus]|nr:hypothetical protein QTP86_030625 [Hemibagrus guttatus]